MQVNDKLNEQNSKLDMILKQDSKQDTQDSKLDLILHIVSQSEIQAPVWEHAMIPPEVPELPVMLQPRPALMAEMKERVLGQAGGTTAVVGVSRGATATTSAHGMGGIGKTIMAAYIIRDPEVGAAFDSLLWVSVSQEPDLLHLLGRLYSQLKSAKLPAWVEGELDASQELRKAAKGVRALLILDDCWEAEHAKMLNCVDADVGSSCVITTRIRKLTDYEIACGLLSVQESLTLLLSSAGLDHLLDNPPAAALEAVECCGRLPLALPIAGGMIRELEEVWEVELVPMLKAELSCELSFEQRIVNASLRCVELSQRAGVEALFMCFGCFAEDEVVPAVALEMLAPIIGQKVAVVSLPRLKVRKWLTSLLKASLLSGSGATGVSVHDLVRNVMMVRAEAEVGGMLFLQRGVLRVFLAAYDSITDCDGGPLRDFIVRSIRHHVTYSQQPGVPLHQDELLMGVLSHKSSEICARSVAGIGFEKLKKAIDTCEGGGFWFEAAQLWAAASTLHASRRGAELKRAWVAISHVQPETGQSRALEAHVLKLLTWVTEGGYTWGSPEHTGVMKRMTVLGQVAQEDASTAAEETLDSAKYDALSADATAQTMNVHLSCGSFSYVPVSPKLLSESYIGYVEICQKSEQEALVAPDLPRRSLAQNAASSHAVWSRMHTLPEFDKEVFTGQGGSRMRSNIEIYDFNVMHAPLKNSGVGFDPFLFGHNEMGLLLWFGDLQSARAGWLKQIEAWKKIVALVQSGEHTWGQYLVETSFIRATISASMAAGEMSVVRDLIQHTFNDIAHADFEQAYLASPFDWKGPDGYNMANSQTWTLQARALAALADYSKVDLDELSIWLPRPDELIYIAQHEYVWASTNFGAAHPALLCATLYATCLNAWDDAAAIADGILAIPPEGNGVGFGMHPLARIEAWRLLARCHGARDSSAGACEALECAVSESQLVGYVWMEAESLRDMLRWTGNSVPLLPGSDEKDKVASAQRIQERIDAVTAKFHSEALAPD